MAKKTWTAPGTTPRAPRPLASVAPPSPIAQLPVTAPDRDKLDALKSTLAARLYEVMLEPQSIQSFRDLLAAKNEATRRVAWELALKHAWPVARDEEGGSGGVHITVTSHIPRPEKNVTPPIEITTR